MKRVTPLIIICTVLGFLNLSCEKDGDMDNGIITGFDNRMCSCCGGLLINFKGETQSYVGEFYLIQNSAELGIDQNARFPMHVKVRWTQEGLEPVTCALGNIIKVLSIKKLN